MERFLERVAVSDYKDNFVIKGGMLITSMIGIALRSRMDIDTSVKNQNLSAENMTRIVEDIKNIKLDDGVTFEIKNISNIMDEMEYPGIRISINAIMGKLITPMKIDISTGDVIIPAATEYKYELLLEDRSINLGSYNIETILAEKLQTILSRGLFNTRMRDFYDVHMLLLMYAKRIEKEILKKAFDSVCMKRETVNLKSEGERILRAVASDVQIEKLWNAYRKKFSYAADIQYYDIMHSAAVLLDMVC